MVTRTLKPGSSRVWPTATSNRRLAPMIIASDFRTILWIMFVLCIASGVIGSIWMPRTQNLTVDEIDRRLRSD